MTREEAIEILEGLAVPIHAEPAFDMAIEALKAQADLQPNCNELATDCISRQDAIDHWRLIIDATSTDSRYNMGFVDGLEFCISHLSTMPSAQPKSEERTEGSAQNVPKEDLISRKAAIDAVKGLPTWWADAGGYYGGAQPPMTALLDPEDTVAAIDNLPSVQPVLDRTKISDLLEKIYSIQSVHLSVEGVLARKDYCKQLWIELLGSEAELPAWLM